MGLGVYPAVAQDEGAPADEGLPVELEAPNLSRSSGLSRLRGVKALPRPDSRDPILQIDKNNLNEFKPSLVKPISDWIQNELIVLNASGSTEFQWSLGYNWNRHSLNNLRKVKLSKDGSLGGAFKLEGGFPFGRYEQVDKISDPAEKARRVVWNSYAAQSAVRDSLYDFTIDWVGYQSSMRNAKALFYRRSFPLAVGVEVGARVPSKLEFLSFYQPSVILGYATTLASYLGQEKDSYWHFSPVVAGKRQLLPANRSDSLINSKLALDDFFVWSGQPESFDVDLLGERLMLMPVASLTHLPTQVENMSWQSLPLASQDNGSSAAGEAGSVPGSDSASLVEGTPVFSQTKTDSEKVLKVAKEDSKSSLMSWGFQEGARSGFAAWRPSGGNFVLRDVWIVRLSPRDPNYLYGRQVVFFDKESSLPLMKLAYGQSGTLNKIVMGFWGFTEADENKRSFPVLAGLLASDPESRSATIWRTQSMTLFNSKQSKILPKLRRALDIDFHLRLNGVEPEPNFPEEEEESENIPKPVGVAPPSSRLPTSLPSTGLPSNSGSFRPPNPSIGNLAPGSLPARKPRRLPPSDEF